MTDKANDPSSLSDPSKIITKHLSIDWNVDFTQKIFVGSVTLSLEVQTEGVGNLVLDTNCGLLVSEVIDNATGEKLTFDLGEPVGALGTPLSIRLPSSAQAKGSKPCVKISYQTSPTASAIGWLEPSQTAGKQHPYLYSQCQAIHARSIIPCQDSPAVKATYDAKVTVPRDLVCLMSALGTGDEPGQDVRTFTFQQQVPMPSYLIAIAVGALESRQIGPRSKVWTEKEFIDKAAYEFAETEQMLSIAESLLGPYVWGQYDLLILPPSFPYGGMENPCLTFVTPTLLAGDRSLADVVAHEIAHSWTGNLVTNCSWEHFWLNEGFTVFVERKIAARMKGESDRHFRFIGGWKELYNSVEKFGTKERQFTHLILPLEDGTDPDYASSLVPYEKGSCFLYFLESLVGIGEFEAFLKAYIEKFKYRSLTTQHWKDFLMEYFHEKAAAGVFDCVEWDKWFFAPGMPPVKPEYDTSLVDVCTKLCERWSQAAESDFGGFSSNDFDSMSSSQRVEFLAQLLLKPPLTPSHMRAMQKLYNLDSQTNSEVRFRWLRLRIRAGDESAIQGAIDMVTATGRMKFTRVLYRDMFAFPAARQRAVDTFQAERHNMHPITAAMVAKDLEVR